MIYLVLLTLVLLMGLLVYCYRNDIPEYPFSTEEELIPWGMRWDEGIKGPLPSQKPPHD